MESNSLDIQSIIEQQLAQFYSVISNERGNRVKVRKYSICASNCL